MSQQPLLEGKVQPDEVTRLRREIAGLEQELQAAKDEAAQAKQAVTDSAVVIRLFRKEFEGQFRFFKALFGEASRVDVSSSADGDGAVNTADKGVWNERLSRVSGESARILQALLDGGGPMTHAQISRAARSSHTSARLSGLMAKNWVQKVGHGSYALK